jgi:outer membrane autotransporter protein
MKKFFLASAIAAVTASSGAATTKHGFYVGAGLAGLNAHHNATITEVEPGPATTDYVHGYSKFAPGGDIMLGYTALINTFLLGVEVDYLFGNLNKTNSFSQTNGTSRVTKVESTGGAWGASVRLGFNCLDRIMPYVRLGIENRRFKLTSVSTNIGVASNVDMASSARKTAFTPGIGVDFKVNKNFALGLEYRYAIYGSITKTGNNPFVPYPVTFKVTPRIGTALLSLKYVWGS